MVCKSEKEAPKIAISSRVRWSRMGHHLWEHSRWWALEAVQLWQPFLQTQVHQAITSAKLTRKANPWSIKSSSSRGWAISSKFILFKAVRVIKKCEHPQQDIDRLKNLLRLAVILSSKALPLLETNHTIGANSRYQQTILATSNYLNGWDNTIKITTITK